MKSSMAKDKPSAKRFEIAVMISLFLAVLLSMLNYYDPIQVMIPNWVLLVVIYWSLAAPDQFSIFAAWGVGLLLDIIDLTILGQHALSFAFVALIVSVILPKTLQYSMWIQCIFVTLLSILVIGYEFWINHLAFGYEFSTINWQSGIVAGLMWPLIRVILDNVWSNPNTRND